MKKYFFLIFAGCLLFTVNCFGQFFQGIGITAGLTKAKQLWFITLPDSSTNKIKKKNILGFNASVRAEFINSDYVRWVTEIQFNQKGCKDKTDSATYKNRLNYICWNNFLKLQYETYYGFPYILFGPRVEYLLKQKTKSPDITGKFKKFNFSLSGSIGFEKVVYDYFKPFVEIHYNPDTPVYYAYENDPWPGQPFYNAYQNNPMSIRNRAWEFRIGVIYRPAGHDSCPGVIY